MIACREPPFALRRETDRTFNCFCSTLGCLVCECISHLRPSPDHQYSICRSTNKLQVAATAISTIAANTRWKNQLPQQPEEYLSVSLFSQREATMSQPDPKEGGRSPASPLQSVPEDESTPPTTPDLQRTGSAPVVFTDSFSPANQDGKRAVITSPAASPEIRRPSEPPRRQSLIRFNTSTAEDTIRRESVAAGKMPTADAKRMSVGERRQSEGGADAGRGRRMSSPPPKRYVFRGQSALSSSHHITIGLTSTKIIKARFLEEVFWSLNLQI